VAVTNYLQLRAAICDTVNKDDISDDVTAFEGTTIDSTVKRAVEKCTLRIQRDLVSRGGHKNMEAVNTSLTLTGGTQTFTLPTDFVGMRSFIVMSNPQRVLTFTDPNSLFLDYGGAAPNMPEKYTLIGTNTAYLGPTPDSSYAVTIVYMQALTVLTNDTDTNWLLTGHWDIYESAAMLELCLTLEADERAQFWQQSYTQRMNDLMGDDRNVRWAATPTIPSVQVPIA
jgi:hypothetical protein